MKTSIEVLTMAFPQQSTLDMLLLKDETGKTVATVTVKTFARFIEFTRLYVHADHRRKGYGRALICEILNRTAGKQFESVTCLVHKMNHEAVQFYRTLGFFIVHIDGDDYLMTYKISLK